MDSSVDNHIGRIVGDKSWFFLCDMQDEFKPSNYPEILKVAALLLQSANVLNIPVIRTEHEEFGETRTELDVSRTVLFTKTSYSMLTPEVVEKLAERPDADTVILFGICSNCCVLQTCFDLITHGYKVHVVFDAVSSDSLVDRSVGIELMRSSGAFVTTSESVLFEILRDSKHPAFQQIQALIKEPPHNTFLFNYAH